MRKQRLRLLIPLLVLLLLSGCGGSPDPDPPAVSSDGSGAVVSAAASSETADASASGSVPDEEPPEPVRVPAAPPVEFKTANTYSEANVRSGPGTEYPVVGKVKAGAYMYVLSDPENDWTAIRRSDGIRGYIDSSLLNVRTTLIQPPPPEIAEPISEEEAYDRLMYEQENFFPDGSYWNDGGEGIPFDSATNNLDLAVSQRACNHGAGRYDCNKHFGIASVPVELTHSGQCLGFASLLSDRVFGASAPIVVHTDWDRLKVGDAIRLTTYRHSMIVLTKSEDAITIAECNADFNTCRISWGRTITREELESRDRIYITRYPEPESDGTSQVVHPVMAVSLYEEPSADSAVVTLQTPDCLLYVINSSTADWYLVETEDGYKGYVEESAVESLYNALIYESP